MLFQHFETFCRVVDEGSFTKAADSLGFSQPTVTKQVRNLEAEIGAELLERNQRDLHLSPAGEIVYTYARRVLNTVRECRTAVESLRTPGRGDLDLGAVFTIALFTLPPLLEAYRQAHPHVTIHVRTGSNQEILAMVLRNEVDVALSTVPLSHAQVKTIPLFEDRVVLVASPRSQWAERSVVDPAEMSELPVVSYQRQSQFRGFVDANFEAAGITPNIVMEFDSHEVVKTMVQLGLGVAMIPESAVREDLKAGRLVRMEIRGFPHLARVTSALVRQDRHETPAMAAFLELLTEALST